MQTYVRLIHTLEFSNISKYNEIQLKNTQDILKLLKFNRFDFKNEYAL